MSSCREITSPVNACHEGTSEPCAFNCISGYDVIQYCSKCHDLQSLLLSYMLRSVLSRLPLSFVTVYRQLVPLVKRYMS